MQFSRCFYTKVNNSFLEINKYNDEMIKYSGISLVENNESPGFNEPVMIQTTG